MFSECSYNVLTSGLYALSVMLKTTMTCSMLLGSPLTVLKGEYSTMKSPEMWVHNKILYTPFSITTRHTVSTAKLFYSDKLFTRKLVQAVYWKQLRKATYVSLRIQLLTFWKDLTWMTTQTRDNNQIMHTFTLTSSWRKQPGWLLGTTHAQGTTSITVKTGNIRRTFA